MTKSSTGRKKIFHVVNFLSTKVQWSPIPKELSTDELIHTAEKNSKLNDLGDDWYPKPLEVLVQSLNDEAGLDPTGLFFARIRILKLLTNRLRATHYFGRNPEILETKIEKPIIITGLPQAGATLLHRMICNENWADYPSFADCLNPVPFIPKSARKKKNRAMMYLKTLNVLNPSFAEMHPIGIHMAEDDILLLDHSFCTYSHGMEWNVPMYMKWLADNDLRFGYDYLKKLQLLIKWQSGGKKWICKSPFHLSNLKLLVELFPDALFVQVHRSPVASIGSLCNFIEKTRSIYSEGHDLLSIGDLAYGICDSHLQNSRIYRKENPNLGIVDIRFEDLLSDGKRVIADLCERAGISFSSGRGNDYFPKFPKTEPGQMNRLEEYGLLREWISEAFVDYMDEFDL